MQDTVFQYGRGYFGLNPVSLLTGIYPELLEKYELF